MTRATAHGTAGRAGGGIRPGARGLGNRLGPYELIRPLARGGMADLHLARRGAEPPVALKILDEARCREPDARAMFRDEAALVAVLDHPHIAAARELAELDGRAVLALEYVHGADLREILATAQHAGVSVPIETAISIVCAAAAGLDHAHRRCDAAGAPLRVVHRDVSLSNIMVGHDGAVKVIDFGIASSALASVAGLPGVVRGKASYMSPEQCLGEPVDHRADVFGLGVVLYELTLGARCFPGKNDFERMLAVVKHQYVAPHVLAADYPAALAEVIATALARDPARRFASAAAMIEALERVAVAQGWVGGAHAIARLMHSLFGAVPAPCASPPDDAAVTEPHAWPPPALAERRLARGTEVGAAARRTGDFADDLDDRTHGRGARRRLSRPRFPIAPPANCA